MRSSLHRFIKNKSCQTNLISLYEKLTGLVDEGKYVTHADFSKDFDIVAHDIFVSKPWKYKLDATAVW